MNMPTMPPPKAPPPKSAAPARPATAIPSLALPVKKAIVPRVLFMAVEGFGKTSLAAFAPGAVILQARGETGYQTLVDAGRVPMVPTALVESWDALLGVLDALIAEPGEARLVALDALGGFERLCHEHVCNRDFKGDWGEKGFSSFHKGYDLAVTDWLGLLNRLDRLNEKGIAILLLSHVQVKSFKNPAGSDFDRYEAACHAKTAAVTYKWADASLFGQFLTITDKQGGRTKGIGGTDRVVYTERRDAFDSKNRFGMPEQIDIPADPSKGWSTLISHIIKGP
jgi:hypothetical protein